MFEAVIVKGKSKKGADYVALDIEIAPNYKKRYKRNANTPHNNIMQLLRNIGRLYS